MGWDRRTDAFTVGQWLKGRIYERRCDLSLDGLYLIYFAMNGRWDSKAKGSWTAISRTPYLKAIALFAKGDCWHGGGLFTDKRTYWLNDGYGHTELQNSRDIQRDLNFQPEAYGGECPGVYYPRLLRDGCQQVEHIDVERWSECRLFEKRARHGWFLRKIAHSQTGAPPGKGCYWDEHALVNTRSGREIACPEWEWADIDDNRVVWATNGKLFASSLQKDGLDDEQELFDFNDMRFEQFVAPY